MNVKKIWPGLILVIAAVALLAGYTMWPRPSSTGGQGDSAASSLRPVRPSEPPVPGRDMPVHPPEPQPPRLPPGYLATIYQDARKAGEPRPGDKAFRANVEAFMKYNRAFAEDQARAEGLTVEEVGELTYLGFLAERTQSWADVEDMIGHELSEEARQRGEDLLHDTNKKFKEDMRKLVADKAPVEERWKLIRDTEGRYKDAYFAITGMNSELLDDLLAGDLGKPYAPSVTPPPDDIGENPDYVPPSPRPDETP